MNERIKELGRQAWAKTLESVEFYDAVGDLNEDFHIKYNQVFAELIVRECLNKVNEAVYAKEMSSRYYPDSDGKKILEHFGVEV